MVGVALASAGVIERMSDGIANREAVSDAGEIGVAVDSVIGTGITMNGDAVGVGVGRGGSGARKKNTKTASTIPISGRLYRMSVTASGLFILP